MRTLKKCLRCRHQWLSHLDRPKRCPDCHSWFWDTKRKKHELGRPPSVHSATAVE